MPVYKNITTKIDKTTGKERTITSYYVSTRYKDWEGKNQRHVKRGFATKKEAKEYEAKFISSISNNCSILFEDLVDRYIENKKLKDIKLSTLENKLSVIRAHILPTFGKMPIDTITPIIIQKWQKKLKGKDNFFLTVMFLLPMFPDDVLCFIAGLSSMSVRYFAIMIILSRLFAIGTTCYSIRLIPFNTWWGACIWGLIIAIIIGAFIVAYKYMDVIQKKISDRKK